MADWNCTVLDHYSVRHLYEDIQNLLNGFTPVQAASVKVAVVDRVKKPHRDEEHARGIVFHTNSEAPADRPRGKWQCMRWETDSNYTGLYGHVTQALSGVAFDVAGKSVTLSESQAYYSLVCAADHGEHHATIALYWLE